MLVRRALGKVDSIKSRPTTHYLLKSLLLAVLCDIHLFLLDLEKIAASKPKAGQVSTHTKFHQSQAEDCTIMADFKGKWPTELAPLTPKLHPSQVRDHTIVNGVKDKRSGKGEFNANEPFGNNPFILIPPVVNPLRLVWQDLLLIAKVARLLPLTVAPLTPCASKDLDELYLTLPNMIDVLLHTILLIIQLVLILAFPIMTVLFWFLPGLVSLVFALSMLVITLAIMRLLNGGPRSECLVGLPPDGQMPVNDEHELWFFINGITIGYAKIPLL